MNQRKAKQIRKLLSKSNPELLLALNKVYGEKTKEMEYHQVYRAAKTLYKKGYLKI